MEFKFTNKALEKLGDAYIQELTDRLLSLGKKASGDLIGSLDYDVVKTTEGLILELEALQYLKWVDEGRKPDTIPPPIKPIEKWIKDKGLKFRDKKGRFISRKSSAFIVARSINRDGIKPTGVLEDTINSLLTNNSELIFAFQEDVEKILEEMISKIKL